MKDFIIAFFICLAITCALNDVGAVPVAMPSSISGVDVLDGKTGVRRKAMQIPEINVGDAAMKEGAITHVEDTDQRESSQSQMGSNF